jgi:hypothetical protein
MKYFALILICLLASCTTETERELRAVQNKTNLDSVYRKVSYQNIWTNTTKSGIEYGYIVFKNNDTVKYWFQSHHLSNDLGGTLFEFPAGETEFIEGYFCCEVWLPNDGNFDNAESFLKKMRELDGSAP